MNRTIIKKELEYAFTKINVINGRLFTIIDALGENTETTISHEIECVAERLAKIGYELYSLTDREASGDFDD